MTVQNEIISALEAKVDALIAYTKTLERRNTLLEQQVNQGQGRTKALEAQKEALAEQLIVLAASLEVE